MEEFFASGHVALALLGLLLAEGVVLLSLSGRRRGVPAGPLLAFLAAGACLTLALHAALLGQHWGWVALWLGLALPPHLVWIVMAWRHNMDE